MAKTKVGQLRIDANLATAKLQDQVQKLGDRLTQQTAAINRKLKAEHGKASQDVAKSWQQAFALIGTAMTVGAIVKMGTAIADLAREGGRVSGITDNFIKLGGSGGAIAQAGKETLGLVSKFDLMANANRLLISGLPQVNEHFGDIAKVAARAADILGVDTKVALEQLTDALIGGKAKALLPFGIAIQDTGDKAQNTVAALQALTEAADKMAEAGDDVGNAYDAVGTALADGYAEIGIAINENDALRASLREIEDQLKGVDWKYYGEVIAGTIRLIAEAANWSTPLLKNFALSLDYLFEFSDISKLTAMNEEVEKLSANLSAAQEKLNKQKEWDQRAPIIPNPFHDSAAAEERKASVLSKLSANVERERAILDAAVKDRDDYLKKLREQREIEKKETSETKPTPSRTYADFIAGSKGAADAQERLEKQTEATRKKITEQIESMRQQNIADVINQSIQDLDQKGFEDAMAQMVEVAQKGSGELANEMKKAGGFSIADIEEARKLQEEKLLNPLREGWAKAQEEKKKQELQDLEEVAQKTRDVYREIFSDAFSGATVDLQTSIKEVVSNFASDFAAAFDSSGEQGITSIAGVGQRLTGLVMDLGGQVSTNAQGQAVGPNGQVLANYNPNATSVPMAEQIAGWTTVAQYAIQSKDTDKSTKSNEGSGQAVGAAVGAVVGTIIPVVGTLVGAMVGSVIGGFIGSMMKWGPQNDESKDRHTVANYIEDLTASSMIGMRFNDKTYFTKPGRFNFFEGSTNRFDEPGWQSRIADGDQGSQSAFLGVGNALKEIAGVSSAVGDQLALTLSDTVGASVDNLRLLVEQLNISLDDAQKALLETATKGNIRWSEWLRDSEGLNQAFGAGLVAVGDYQSAFENLVSSGGRGIAATRSFRDIAVEAMEAGVTTFAQLQERLLAGGATAEQVSALMQSVNENGITDLKGWSEATNEQAGTIVGNMEGLSQSLTEQWSNMNASIEELNNKLAKIPSNVPVDIQIKISGDTEAMELISQANYRNRGDVTAQIAESYEDDEYIPADEEASTFHGIKKSLSSTNGGFSASQKVKLPTTQTYTNGKSLVTSRATSTQINIDARGADAGVENRIYAALASVEESAIRRTLEIMGGV